MIDNPENVEILSINPLSNQSQTPLYCTQSGTVEGKWECSSVHAKGWDSQILTGFFKIPLTKYISTSQLNRHDADGKTLLDPENPSHEKILGGNSLPESIP